MSNTTLKKVLNNQKDEISNLIEGEMLDNDIIKKSLEGGISKRSELYPYQHIPIADISTWGRIKWASIAHTLNSKPDVLSAEEMAETIIWMMHEAKHLPCPKCRVHFGKNISEGINLHDPQAYTRAYLLRWLKKTQEKIAEKEYSDEDRVKFLKWQLRHKMPSSEEDEKKKAHGMYKFNLYDQSGNDTCSENGLLRILLWGAVALLLIACIGVVATLALYGKDENNNLPPPQSKSKSKSNSNSNSKSKSNR